MMSLEMTFFEADSEQKTSRNRPTPHPPYSDIIVFSTIKLT